MRASEFYTIFTQPYLVHVNVSSCSKEVSGTMGMQTYKPGVEKQGFVGRDTKAIAEILETAHEWKKILTIIVTPLILN